MFVNFAQPICLPPYWLNHPEVVRRYEENDLPDAAQLIGIEHACPLSLKRTGEPNWWQLPIEPVVTISCKNNIVQREILKVSSADKKQRGTVKELWSQADYEISISGVFISTAGKLPEDDIRQLRNLCEARESIEVKSPLFTLFDIQRIVIEDYQFPFTKGIENQMFSLKCLSDDFDEAQLLIIE